MSLVRDDRMTVAAHRGDSYNYYENTMTAFKMAHAVGADMIETDIHLTKDNHLVLIHDDTVDRTTNGSGRVCEMTFDEIRALNASDKNSYECVPTLEELFAWAQPLDITFNLEIKEYNRGDNRARCEKCIDDTLALVEKYGLSKRIIINSFDAYVLEYVYKKHGKKYALHGFYPYWEMFNVSINPDEYLYCACVFQNDHPEHYAYLAEHGIQAWIGASVTQKSKLDMCAKYGARLITTNNPRDILEKLK